MRLPDGRGDSPDPLITRVVQNSLQAFYKRFSGPERTQMSDRQGADARRDATSGHFVCFSRPGAGALDQVIEVRTLGGATSGPMSRYAGPGCLLPARAGEPVARFCARTTYSLRRVLTCELA